MSSISSQLLLLEDRPVFAMSSSLQNEVDLPLIDISQFPSQFEERKNDIQCHSVVATVREACEDWGFFTVVNHGIPVDLLQEVDSQIRQLCALPAEVKEKAATCNAIESYSVTAHVSESFCFMKVPHSDSVQEMCNRIWPADGNPKFCEAIRTYTLFMAELGRRITEIILASLGLDAKTFYHSDFEGCTTNLRINHYPFNGKSEEEEILFSHTDGGCFTILNQDKEGGLQVRSKQGMWLNVKPRPHSFVVNVADSLKAWSNGRYRSAEHRVVYKGWTRNRISVLYFVHFPEDKEICAPAELVDDDHPPRYKPFIVSQFKNEVLKNLYSEEKNLTAFIDIYAGV